MNYAVVLAGGVGKRMGAGVPKQFIEIDGKPILVHALERFAELDEIDKIVVVTVDVGETLKLVVKYNIPKIGVIVIGGATRRDSSKIGCETLLKLGAGRDDIVLIHDAARPFVTKEIILANIEAVKKHGACETAEKIHDTVISAKDERLSEIIPRDGLFLVQTPQSFRLGIICDAHAMADELTESEQMAITDDAGMVKRFGRDVVVVPGNRKNIKITTPEDLL